MADPIPLGEQDTQGDILEPTPKQDPPPAQEPVKMSLPEAPKPKPVKDTSSVKIREAYQRLRQMKTSDLDILLHETLKNIDEKWLLRALIGIVVDAVRVVEVWS